MVSVICNVCLAYDASRDSNIGDVLVLMMVRMLHIEKLGAILLVQRPATRVFVQPLGFLYASSVLEHVRNVVHKSVHVEARSQHNASRRTFFHFF